MKRQEVLKRLENALAGVTSNAILEQSNTFVFEHGRLITFNGEFLTRQKSPFGDEITGSIMAGDFLRVLQRFPDDILKIEERGGELRIKGKRRSAGVKMMAEIILPYEEVPKPKKFKKVPKELIKLLLQAAQICGKDKTAPKTTHVHIAEDRVEATDSYRVFRGELETKIQKSVLVQATSLILACRFDVKGAAIDGHGWFHLKTEDGMVMSLLCSEDKYYKKDMIDDLLSVDGDKVTFPKNLSEVLSRAEIMDTPGLSIGGWDSQVTISLDDNSIRVSSRKEEGWFKEERKAVYDGPPLTFSIHPLFLKDLVSRTREAIISDTQIKVEVDNIHFTAALEAGGDQ